MNVFEIAVDPERNVLTVYYRGVVSGDSMKVHADHIVQSISKLGPGFTLVTDLTDLERMELDCVPHLTRFMDLFVAAAVGKIVRVIPDPDKDIGFNLLSLTHYRGCVPIASFASKAEAEVAATGR